MPLITELKARGKAPEDAWLKGDYDVDVQARLCREVGCWAEAVVVVVVVMLMGVMRLLAVSCRTPVAGALHAEGRAR